MDEAVSEALVRAHSLSTPENLRTMNDVLNKLNAEAVEDRWHIDTLLNLWSELVMDFRLLELSYLGQKDGFSISRPSVMAWRARNLLELSVWLEYCLKSKENARRFYEDKMRDAFEWISVVQTLYELFPNFPGAEQVKQAKTRLEASALHTGIADVDESYTRVTDVARELGHRQAWSVMNKLLSKFAHPTALSVLTLTQGAVETSISDFFLIIGCLSFIGSMEDFDEYLKSLA